MSKNVFRCILDGPSSFQCRSANLCMLEIHRSIWKFFFAMAWKGHQNLTSELSQSSSCLVCSVYDCSVYDLLMTYITNLLIQISINRAADSSLVSDTVKFSCCVLCRLIGIGSCLINVWSYVLTAKFRVRQCRAVHRCYHNSSQLWNKRHFDSQNIDGLSFLKAV